MKIMCKSGWMTAGVAMFFLCEAVHIDTHAHGGIRDRCTILYSGIGDRWPSLGPSRLQPNPLQTRGGALYRQSVDHISPCPQTSKPSPLQTRGWAVYRFSVDLYLILPSNVKTKSTVDFTAAGSPSCCMMRRWTSRG